MSAADGQADAVVDEGAAATSMLARGGLWAGPLLAVVAWWLLPSAYSDAGGNTVELGGAARATAAIATWMAVWWMTEAVHIAVTSLLPIGMLPVLGGVAIKDVTAPYGHELVYLFLGGFMLALAMQRWGLHTRIALLVLRYVGSQPRTIVGAFMATTAFLSAWVSNTATTTMMLPVALSAIALVAGGTARDGLEGEAAAARARAEKNFATALMLGVAYASTMGGMATMLGTAPNLFLVSYARDQLGVEMTFLQWLAFGVPVAAMYLPATWWILTRWLFPIDLPPVEGSREQAHAQWKALGPLSRGEWTTLVVFVCAAAGWIVRPYIESWSVAGVAPFSGLTDSGIAVLAALALFVLPSGRGPVLDWQTGTKLPWGVLLLFGAGFSLAAAIETSGLGAWIGQSLAGLGSMPPLALVVVTTSAVALLSEFASNAATTATLVPVLANVATAIGMSPMALIVPVTLAASSAYALPVGTPPNAIVYGTGHVTMRDMVKAGLVLDVLGVVIIAVVTWFIVLPLYG
jgi:sodium-dependent dicarboxylate transporter 2/3/5